MKKFRREIPTIYRQSKISSTASFLSCKIRRSLSKQLTSEWGKTSVKTSMARKYCRSVKRKGVAFDWLWYWWRNLRCNMSTFPLELFLSVDCLLRNFSIIFYICWEREREREGEREGDQSAKQTSQLTVASHAGDWSPAEIKQKTLTSLAAPTDRQTGSCAPCVLCKHLHQLG